MDADAAKPQAVHNEGSKPISLMLTAGTGAVPKEEPRPTSLCQLMLTESNQAGPSEEPKQVEKAGQQVVNDAQPNDRDSAIES